jgi:serine/threonine-protein kinase
MLNFLGGPRTFKYISAVDLLDGTQGRSLEGKIVVLSPTCLAGRVLLGTRMADDFPASEVTATAIENIITESYVHKPTYSALVDLLIMAVIGLFAAVVLPKVSLLYRFVILGASLFVIINLQYLLFASFGWLTQAFYPALLIVFFMAVCPFMRSREEREAHAHRPAQRQKPTVLAVGEAGSTPQGSTPASEPTTLSGGEGTLRAGFDETAMAAPASAPSATARLEGSTDPTRLVGAASPDAPTRQMQSGAGQPSGTETESLFVEGDRHALIAGAEADRDETIQAGLAARSQGPAAAASTSEAGSTLGRYQIIEEIGRGAMGVVYRGIDPAINRPVALKTVRLDQAVPPSEKEELRTRLMREAQAAGQLSHPNIVTVFDVGSQGDIYYIAMEYLKGYTLERAVQKKLTLNYKIFAKLIIQVCDALEYAHSNDLVHRDVKPANIMVLDNFRVKVMDFGIARVTNSNMTQTGVALGTPSYISPEQLSGHGVDRRSDIFSLGVVMYELLTKEKPFAGESINKLIFNILNSKPRRPTQLDANIPEAFDRICLRALEKDPQQRYQYAADLSRDLKEFIASLSPRRMVI